MELSSSTFYNKTIIITQNDNNNFVWKEDECMGVPLASLLKDVVRDNLVKQSSCKFLLGTFEPIGTEDTFSSKEVLRRYLGGRRV